MTITLHAYGLTTPEMLPKAVRAAYGELLGNVNRKATAVIEDLSSKLDRLTHDDTLSRKGVAEKRKEAGLAAYARLEEGFKNPLAKLDQDLKRAQEGLPRRLPMSAAISAPPVDPNTASVFVQLDAALAVDRIRQELKELDPLEALAVVQAAARSGEAQIVFAVQSLSPWQRERIGMDEKAWDAILKDYWSEANPRAFARVDTVEQALLTVRGNLNTAKKKIGEVSGATPDHLDQDSLLPQVDRAMRVG